MTGDEIQIVTFRVGSQEFGLNVFQVERILRYLQPAMLPNAPDFLEGVVPYGGSVVPVVDLRKRLSLKAVIAEETRLMILEIEAQRVGFLVDQVIEVLRVDSGAIAAPPAVVRGLAAEFISGILSRGERTVVILNAARLLSSRERLSLAEVGAGA